MWLSNIIRFHGLYHDDMFVYREAKTACRCITFNMSTSSSTSCWRSASSHLWNLVFAQGSGAAKRHGFLVERPRLAAERFCEVGRTHPSHHAKLDRRYGIEEVRTWYFEVWNEPNLIRFFAARRANILSSTKSPAPVLKKIDAATARRWSRRRATSCPTRALTAKWKTRPASRGSSRERHRRARLAAGLGGSISWICQREGLPVDFVSCIRIQPIGRWTNTAGNSKIHREVVNATPRDLARLTQYRRGKPVSSRRKSIHGVEFQFVAAGFHTRFFAGGDIRGDARFSTRIGCVDSLSYWTFTDVFEESGAGDRFFTVALA